ncbi:SPOR domain-containing protein [Congregibacter brevis]|uniref:SPOR domain-containing protein n=1 Tax=Congregibacter brevis TaxID=3081201 RepID=A0ABZ0I9F1_9GAMM|nr:SPOR domain-containing protein [Congregibacter sp. IMCC45268]
MDNLVKQRLVGALILVALAVVFWPIIFVPGAQQSSDLRVVVPSAPPVDLTPLPEPDSLGMRSGTRAAAQDLETPDVELPATDELDAEPASLPSREETMPVANLDDARSALESPAMDEDGLPVAYSLQVATMGDKARAESLRDELVSAGYKGYVKRMRRDDRVLYRVLVGPRYSKDELLPVKDAVDKRWRVESLIIRYLP